MATWGYEFHLLVLKVSLTRSLRSALDDKIRISARPCNILNHFVLVHIRLPVPPLW